MGKAKMFAVIVAILAILSAIPVITGHWFTGGIVLHPPIDISTHGHLIDEQMKDTMLEAGLAFLAAQLVLAGFVWKFGGRTTGELKTFPGGAKWMVIAAFVLVGTEVIALGMLGTKAWADVYFTPASADALPIQVQTGQFAFYFRYAGPDGKFGAIHPDKIDEGNSNFFGLDPANDVDARDDIQSGELVVPVNREVHLMLHGKDVIHNFYVRELRLQQDVVPGIDIGLHFTATKIGKYEIVCTQLCGLGHYNMKAYLNVMSESDFEQWLKQQSS